MKFLNFKTNDNDIGYFGTLDLYINSNKILISSKDRMIKFCKDGIFIDGYSLFFKGILKTLSLTENEIIEIIKTLNFMLENKQMIFESLEKYISESLNAHQ